MEQDTVGGDEDYVLVEYDHPNRGGHRVVGAATKTFYGHRSGGERFLVHREDIKLQPNFFIPVKEKEAPKPEPEPVAETPEPELISQTNGTEISIHGPDEEVDVSGADEVIIDDVSEKTEPNAPIAVLEITGAQHEKLMDAGFETVQDIVNAKRSELLDIPGFGPATVNSVMDEVKKWQSL